MQGEGIIADGGVRCADESVLILCPDQADHCPDQAGSLPDDIRGQAARKAPVRAQDTEDPIRPIVERGSGISFLNFVQEGALRIGEKIV